MSPSSKPGLPLTTFSGELFIVMAEQFRAKICTLLSPSTQTCLRQGHTAWAENTDGGLCEYRWRVAGRAS